MHQIFSFVLAGMFAAFLNILSRFVFSFYLNYYTSIIFAYVIGMVAAFLLMRRFVFSLSKKPLRYQFMKFVVVNMFNLTLTLIVSAILFNLLSSLVLNYEFRELISHSVGVLVPIIISFLAHKYYSFN